jgi:hypothetical protein
VDLRAISEIPGDPQFIGSPNKFREKLSIVPSKVEARRSFTCSSTPSDQRPDAPPLDLLPFRRHPAPPANFPALHPQIPPLPCGESHATIRSTNFATTDQTDHPLFQSERSPDLPRPSIINTFYSGLSPSRLRTQVHKRRAHRQFSSKSSYLRLLRRRLNPRWSPSSTPGLHCCRLLLLFFIEGTPTSFSSLTPLLLLPRT